MSRLQDPPTARSSSITSACRSSGDDEPVLEKKKLCRCFLVGSAPSSMKLSNVSTVPVYTIAGASTARPLPEWLARKRKRSLKHDPEYASRIELLQDFEFEEASSCVRVSEDGEWAMSTGEFAQSNNADHDVRRADD